MSWHSSRVNTEVQHVEEAAPRDDYFLVRDHNGDPFDAFVDFAEHGLRPDVVRCELPGLMTRADLVKVAREIIECWGDGK